MRSLYLSIRPLSAAYSPCRIWRRGDITLQVVDPRAFKPELLMSAYDQLRPWELEAGRRAYGQPLQGVMAQSLVEGAVLPYVPPALRVPGEPAIQNPVFATRAHRQAFRDAVNWLRVEAVLFEAQRRVS